MLKRKKSLNKISGKRPLKEFALFLLDILYNAVIIIVLVVLIRTFLISPFRVIGSSMADTLINNEFILIDKLSYRLGEPKRGDPIVFLPPLTNKYPQKFEEIVTTDTNGKGILNIGDLSREKNVFYCHNQLIQTFWFCKEKVEADDQVYYLPLREKNDGAVMDLSWRVANKKTVTSLEVKEKKITIEGEPGQSYILRVYNSTGPEYFVKRIIGVPGDTVRIENGRVYLKTPKDTDFTEINESYLNEENRFNTYYKKTPGEDDFKVPDGFYFVLGDNRTHSNDSRHWFSPIDEKHTPFVKSDDISGKVLIVLWPPQNLHFIPSGVLQETL